MSRLAEASTEQVAGRVDRPDVAFARATWRRPPTLETLVVGTLTLFGFRIGLRGISDNSAFLHLRTGIDMVRRGAIPRADPYSFSAPHHVWVVQSWLAEWVVGMAYRIAGLHFVVFVDGVVAALVAFVIATVARTGSALRTMLAATVAVLAGAVYWAPRPLMFGLLALALTILIVERRRSAWWLLPVGWVWVNTHGSFPLGAAWLAARFVGEVIDGRAWPRWLNRYGVAFLGSLALGALNPLGPKLLTFPLAVERKRRVFQEVVEWRSPDFQSTAGLLTLGCVLVALVILLRGRRRFADILPVVGFLGLGLVSVRNLAPAAVVLAPALARALAPGAPPAVRAVQRINLAFAAVLVAAAVAFTISEQRASPLDLRTYPATAAAYLESHGYLDSSLHRVAEQDIVGDYLVLLRGTHGRVFIDDRVDMYPAAVSDSYDALLHGDPSSPDILNRYGIDVILWDRHLPLVPLLDRLGGWHQAYPVTGAGSVSAAGKPADTRWVVLLRDSSDVRATG